MVPVSQEVICRDWVHPGVPLLTSRLPSHVDGVIFQKPLLTGIPCLTLQL